MLLEITTDVLCERSQGVSIAVGEAGAVEERAPEVVTRNCNAGFIGTLVVRPKSMGTRVAVKVTQGVGRDVSLCTARDGYAQCSVQRREFVFVSNARRVVPIVLKKACVDTACGDHATCASRATCVDSFAEMCDAQGRCIPRDIDAPGVGEVDAAVSDATFRTEAGEAGVPVGYRLVSLGSTLGDSPASSGHSCALDYKGALRCWGSNTRGQLGQDNMINYGSMSQYRVLPVVLGGAVIDMSAGEQFTCAVIEGGGVKCWGAGSKGSPAVPVGELGLGDSQDRGRNVGDMYKLPSVNLGSNVFPRAVAAGEHFACAIVDHQAADGGVEVGRVKCWGNNGFGQLGLGDAVNRGTSPAHMGEALPFLALPPNAVEIRAGGGHACARFANGEVKCWGLNNAGQLGLGGAGDQGDIQGEIAALESVDLGLGLLAVKISVGWRHTCALLEGGALKCWGINTWGQLGTGNNSSVGTGSGQMGDVLKPLPLGGTVTDVCTGVGHTCAIVEGVGVKCWGANHKGQLGLGDTLNRGNGSGPPALTPPPVSLGTRIGDVPVRIGCGSAHTCVALANGSVKCWGYNDSGQLGIGDTTDRLVPAEPYASVLE